MCPCEECQINRRRQLLVEGLPQEYPQHISGFEELEMGGDGGMDMGFAVVRQEEDGSELRGIEETIEFVLELDTGYAISGDTYTTG
jgi:hypothetical protein